MAEVRKKQTNKKYDVDEMLEEKNSKNKKNTKSKNVDKKKVDKKKESNKKTPRRQTEKKQSLWTRFMIFCHGVKSEFDKVFWPTKKDMIKYSITTITFIVFLSIFFYLIDIIFALIQTLIG